MAEVRVVIRIVFRSGERHNEQEVAKIEWGESRPPQSVAFSRVPSLTFLRHNKDSSFWSPLSRSRPSYNSKVPSDCVRLDSAQAVEVVRSLMEVKPRVGAAAMWKPPSRNSETTSGRLLCDSLSKVNDLFTQAGSKVLRVAKIVHCGDSSHVVSQKCKKNQTCDAFDVLP